MMETGSRVAHAVEKATGEFITGGLIVSMRSYVIISDTASTAISQCDIAWSGLQSHTALFDETKLHQDSHVATQHVYVHVSNGAKCATEPLSRKVCPRYVTPLRRTLNCCIGYFESEIAPDSSVFPIR